VRGEVSGDWLWESTADAFEYSVGAAVLICLFTLADDGGCLDS